MTDASINHAARKILEQCPFPHGCCDDCEDKADCPVLDELRAVYEMDRD